MLSGCPERARSSVDGSEPSDWDALVLWGSFIIFIAVAELQVYRTLVVQLSRFNS